MENKNIALIGILLTLVIVAGCQVAYQPPVVKGASKALESFNPSLEIDATSFSTVQELKNFLSEYEGAATFGVRAGGIMVEEMAIASTDSAIAPMAKVSVEQAVDYSETNVQVEGIDEGDIIKTDGNYIYTVSGKTLFIIKAYPGEDAEIVHTKKFDNHPQGLFINDNKLTVFGEINTLDYDFDFTPRSGMTFFEIYDVSDKANPSLVKDYKFEGRYFQSRMIENYVYFVVTSMPEYRRPIPMPIILEDNIERAIGIEDVHYFNIPYDSTQFASIHAINLNDNKVNSKSLVVESSQNMYMSHNNIYITYTKYINEWEIRQDITIDIVEPMLSISDKQYIDKIRKVDNDILSPSEKKSKILNVINTYMSYLPTEEQETLQDKIEEKVEQEMEKYEAQEYTVIHRVKVDGNSIKVEANGKVPGHIINQFSLDEYENVLRLGTTISPRWWGPWLKENERRESTNHVFTLDQSLDVIDRLDDLAEGEQIYSTRFMGDRLYMVTFRQVDPFFVIDLSNPANIKSLGKLKIPGFSRYLHPYDDETIIGIGHDATEQGRTKGLKISLFDVSDVDNPKEVAKFVTKERYAQSAAEYEHKAFLFSKEKELLVIPAYSYDYKDEEGYNGALVFKIQADNIELRGLVDHSKAVSSGRWYQPQVERSLYIEELLYTKSPTLLRINKLEDLSSVKEITLDDVYQGDIPIF